MSLPVLNVQIYGWRVVDSLQRKPLDLQAGTTGVQTVGQRRCVVADDVRRHVLGDTGTR